MQSPGIRCIIDTRKRSQFKLFHKDHNYIRGVPRTKVIRTENIMSNNNAGENVEKPPENPFLATRRPTGTYCRLLTVFYSIDPS